MKEIFKSIGFTTMFLFMIASCLEEGDINAISMYVVVYIIPLIIVSIINGIWLNLVGRFKSDIRNKKIQSLIPVLILVLIIFMKKARIPYFEGTFMFVAIVGALGIGMNNLIWNYHLKTKLEKL